MTLDEWRRSRGYSHRELADFLKYSEVTTRRWCLHERVPRTRGMAIIMRVTRGLVTANDFYSGTPPAKGPRRGGRVAQGHVAAMAPSQHAA